MTRDRQYGYGRLGPVQYVCIDTGGLVENPSGMDALMRIQTEHAIKEADRLIFMADARAGLTPQDQFFARELRNSGKPVFLAVNKAEGLESRHGGRGFPLALASASHYAIAATHGLGCEELMDVVLAGFPPAPAEDENEDGRIRIAVIGRPNVGKSTLINRLIGDERLITSEVAGTTRDSILVPFERDGREFTLIDTAGVRRRAKIDDEIEHPLGVEDAAGHRRGARRRHGGRRAGLDRRTGRERAGPGVVARPGADPRREQVGQHPAWSSARRSAAC